MLLEKPEREKGVRRKLDGLRLSEIGQKDHFIFKLRLAYELRSELV